MTTHKQRKNRLLEPNKGDQTIQAALIAEMKAETQQVKVEILLEMVKNQDHLIQAQNRTVDCLTRLLDMTLSLKVEAAKGG